MYYILFSGCILIHRSPDGQMLLVNSNDNCLRLFPLPDSDFQLQQSDQKFVIILFKYILSSHVLSSCLWKLTFNIVDIWISCVYSLNMIVCVFIVNFNIIYIHDILKTSSLFFSN